MNPKSPRNPLLLTLYTQYLDDQDSVAFTRGAAAHYTPGTLERLAGDLRREIRRAAVLALGFLGDYGANHTLGLALLDPDRSVRLLADNGIREVWCRAGQRQQRRQLALCKRLNEARQYDRAADNAARLIDEAPWFAEAWHQRAAARFHLGRYADAVRDFHETLELNPYHFVAAASMGRAQVELNDLVSALESFRRALRLNPDLEGVRIQVVRLARLVEDA